MRRHTWTGLSVWAIIALLVLLAPFLAL